MRRFFTFMITLSLTAAVSMPFSTVSTYAETSQTFAAETSEASGVETDNPDTLKAVTGSSEASGSETGNPDGDFDTGSGTTVTEADSAGIDAAEDNSEAENEDSDSAGTEVGDKDEDADSASSEPAVIQSDNESSADNPVGDDSSYYNIDNLGEAPVVSAESAILMDAASGAVLYGLEADTRRYPASITKVMTALLVIENCRMDDVVTFSNEAVNGVEIGSSSAGINVGAQLTVEDALYAMMLVSANEAAAALAEHVAGSVDAFAEMMNERATELGCTGTHFTNPHGLPDENHYTTAHDMALILKQAMKYDEFRKVAETISYTLEESDTLTDTLELWNHSKILRENSEYYYKYAEGSKTGFTQAALNTLVTYAKKDNTELLCVILKDYGADSSYNDSAALFEWGFDRVTGITPLSNVSLNSVISASTDIDDSKKEAIRSMKTSFNKNYYILVPKDFDASGLTVAFAPDENQQSQRLGYLTISSGNTVIGKAPVTYEGSTEAPDASKPVSGNEDGLETAPNSDTSLKPHKLLEYILRVFIAVILVVVIMGFIRKRVARKENQKNPGQRSGARSRRRKK